MSAASEDRSDDPTIQPTLRGDGESTARPRVRSAADLPRGATVGRYVLLARVGAGTMGVVHAAYDPHLDRRVALKLLTASATGGTEGRARTFTEAQSLARLSHPNVVAVHDVGKIELSGAETVFLAMEFIEGRTLKEWLAERKRTWSDVLDVFVQAGRGLVAAHAAGMIHRDFKPDNVMITDSPVRRVVVMDFGLAQVLDVDDAEVASERTADAQLLLTLTGKLVGTPAYMPPEAYREDRKQLGPWSDQFSFCVALYEAVYAQRPFVADSLVAQMRAVTHGQPREIPRGSGVPGWLHALIVRGMRAEPSERHASMQALLDALERGRGRGRRTQVMLAGAVGVVAVAGWIASGRSPREACEDGAAQIDARWNDDRREALAGAFARTGLASAGEQWASTAALIDADVEEWRSMYVDACAATHERREQSDALLDARMQCLRERADHLEALLGELDAVDVELVGKAVGAVRQLPAIEDCRAPRTPDREAVIEAADARVVAARAALATARARRDAGRYAAGFRAVEEAAAALGDAPFPRVHAEVQLVRARLHDAIGEHAQAESVLREVVVVATAEGDPRTAALAWVDLIEIVGTAPGRSDEALAFVLATDAAIAAAGGDPVLRRQRLTAEGIVRLDKGQAAEALAVQDEALALALEHEAATDPTVLAVLHTNRGNTLLDLGRFAEAEAAHEESLAIDMAAYGERHPVVAIDLMNLARDVGRHDLERAKDLAAQALAIREEFFGPDSRAVGEVVLTLAINARERGDLPEARALAERALAVWTATLPANHLHLAAVNNELGIIANESGRQDDAIRHYREVERIARAAHGDEHPNVATALQNRGNVLRERGDARGALVLFEEALAIKEKVRGSNHPSLAPLLVGYADVLEKTGRVPEAEAAVERALSIHRASDSGEGDVAWAESVKARVLYAAAPAGSTARAGAVAMARRSLEKLRELGPVNSAFEIDEVDAWVRAHDSGADAP